MLRSAYATDLTDVEWELVEPCLRTSGGGRPPLHSKRELLNAICHGYDAGKQVAGHKRHIAVDAQGLSRAVLVPPASVQDPVGVAPVLAEAKAHAPILQLLWADACYQGPLVATAAAVLGLRVEVVSQPPGTKGFVVLARR